MENILKILPLVLLILVTVFFITRGARTKPDADRNKSDIGGGSGDNRANE